MRSKGRRPMRSLFADGSETARGFAVGRRLRIGSSSSAAPKPPTVLDSRPADQRLLFVAGCGTRNLAEDPTPLAAGARGEPASARGRAAALSPRQTTRSLTASVHPEGPASWRGTSTPARQPPKAPSGALPPCADARHQCAGTFTCQTISHALFGHRDPLATASDCGAGRTLRLVWSPSLGRSSWPSLPHRR